MINIEDGDCTMKGDYDLLIAEAILVVSVLMENLSNDANLTSDNAKEFLKFIVASSEKALGMRLDAQKN